MWISFEPKAGHEQVGRRPALILSSRIYNGKALHAVACSITSQIKGYPFEVLLPTGGEIAGVILADHIRNLDWRARCVEYAGKVPAETMVEVQERLRALLGL